MSVRPRIVSLVPSATETLVAIGADVVACTRFCKQPGLATVGGTKNPDLAAIVALRPDRVVIDTEENRREDADALAAAGVELVVTSVRSVDDAVSAVGQLAAEAGVAPPRLAMAASHHRVIATVFVPIWRRPWMTINGATYGASLLRSLGQEVVTAELDDAYPTVDLAEIAALSPQLILVPSEPYSFTDDHLVELADAFPTSRVLRVDGEDLFWWGIRTPAAQQRLTAALDAGSSAQLWP